MQNYSCGSLSGSQFFVWALSPSKLTVLILLGAHEPWESYLFAVLFGIGFGGEMSAYPVVNRQYFGTGPIGTFYGFEMMGALLGHAIGKLHSYVPRYQQRGRNSAHGVPQQVGRPGLWQQHGVPLRG